MNSYEYATSITAESQKVFDEMFSYYRAMGCGFDAAMQRAIMDEQDFIEQARREAARKGSQN